MKQSTRKLTPDVLLDISRRIRESESLLSVARELGVHPTTLRERLKRAGLWKRRRPQVVAPPLHIPDDTAIRAYIAGIIDGEGCISNRPDKDVYSVSVSNSCLKLIEWLAQFGGCTSSRAGATVNRLPEHRWGVTKQADVEHLLEAIFPYLIIKRAKAQEWLDGYGSRKRRGEFRFRKLSDSQVEEIRQRLATGESQRKIAPDYGITQGAISLIVRGKTHAHQAVDD